MAFNPFHWFRKHQKVFFAGLTILCMLVFIGQFGAGDVVQRGLAWVGAGRGGATVARVDGERINEREFELLGRKRQAADAFIKSAVFRQENFGLTVPRALSVVGGAVKEESKPGSPLARLEGVYRGYTSRLFPSRDARGLDQYRRDIRRDIAVVQDMSRAEGVKDDSDRLRILQTMAAVLGWQAWMLEPASRDFYFGGSRRPDDLLDFLAWKHQADKLGIVLTDKDVVAEVNREAGLDVLGGEDFATNRFVTDFLAVHRQGLTARELLDAVRDEFRVALAQGALVGVEPGARGYRVWLGAGKSPAFATPDEFLRYFRDKRTTLKVKFLSLPVSGFVSQVQGEPTEEQLRQRYDKYKDQEPDPAKEQPGFKEPRRVKVEYVSAGPADDWYRAQGRKAVGPLLVYSDPKPAVAFRFGAGASAACQAGFSGLPGALSLGLPAAFDPLQGEYLAYVEKNTHPWYQPEGETPPEPPAPNRLQPSSLLRPDNAAATFGQLLGAGLGRGSAFAAPAAFYASATVAEARDSARFSTAWLMAHATAGQQFPAVGVLFTRFSLVAPFLPHVPPEKVRPQLVAALEERYAQKTLDNNLTTFTTELAKLKGKPEQARAYVRKAAKEYHFHLAAMREPLGLNAVVDALNRGRDVGLKPLYDAAVRMAAPRPVPADQFADFRFFGERGVYQPGRLGDPEEGRDVFVYWRTEDLPARVRPFEQVRDEVAEAWRFEKARVLARREARRLAGEVNKGRLSPADAERFLREKHPGEFFELDRVSQLVAPEKEVHAGVRTEYRPYQVPEDRKDVFPYPPEPAVKLVRDLLRDLKRPGEAAVVADRPARHFYVAVLVERDEPTLKEFYEVYRRAGRGDDDLWDRFVEQYRDDHRREVLEQLRREASGGKLDAQGRWDIPKEIRDRYEGREGGE